MQIRANRLAVEIVFQTTGPTLHSVLSERAPDHSPLRQAIIAALSTASTAIADILTDAGIDIAMPARDGEFVPRGDDASATQ